MGGGGGASLLVQGDGVIEMLGEVGGGDFIREVT